MHFRGDVDVDEKKKGITTILPPTDPITANANEPTNVSSNNET